MLFRKVAPLIVLLVFISLIMAYIWVHRSDFESLKNISIYYVLLIACFWLFAITAQGMVLRALTVDFGIDLSFREYFAISVMTNFGNIFLPMRGGAGFRAVYLKSKYNFDYSYFVSTLAGNYLISFNIASQIGLAGMAVLFLQKGAFNPLIAIIFLVILLLTSWAIFFPPATVGFIPIKWLSIRLNHVLSGWHTMRRSTKTVLRLSILTLVYIILGTVITWLEFSAFQMKDGAGDPIGFLQSLIFSSIGSLSLLVSITPAALGIRETLLMFSSQFLEISPSQALAVSLLDRTVSFVVIALLATFASITLRRQLHIHEFGPISVDEQDCRR